MQKKTSEGALHNRVGRNRSPRPVARCVIAPVRKLGSQRRKKDEQWAMRDLTAANERVMTIYRWTLMKRRGTAHHDAGDVSVVRMGELCTGLHLDRHATPLIIPCSTCLLLSYCISFTVVLSSHSLIFRFYATSFAQILYAT